MLGTLTTARLCACRCKGDDADGGLSTVRTVEIQQTSHYILYIIFANFASVFCKIYSDIHKKHKADIEKA